MVKAAHGKLTVFYFDIANMFHNIPLPPPFWDLFPLPTVRLGDLPTSTSHSILAHLNRPELPENIRLRRAQSTAPIGFR